MNEIVLPIILDKLPLITSCEKCGGEMHRYLGSRFRENVRIRRIVGWKCFKCGEDIISAQSLKAIEEAWAARMKE